VIVQNGRGGFESNLTYDCDNRYLSLKAKEQLIWPIKDRKGLLRKALQGGFAQLLGEDMDLLG
jgi:hypothetical protein